MKSKYWIMLLALILACCLGLSIFLTNGNQSASQVQIKSGDTVITVNLSDEQEFTLAAVGGGFNTVTIKGGKIAVTAADCPDGYCMDRGFCDGGTPIVCLPHKLVIAFTGEQEIDGIIG